MINPNDRRVFISGIDPYKVDNPFKKFKKKIMFKVARFLNKKSKQ